MFDSDFEPMARANEVFAAVMDCHGLTHEAAANITGYSTTSINRWRNGEGVVPVDVFASLYRATRDLRLVRLVVPDVQAINPAESPAGAATATKRTPPPGEPRELVPQALDATRHLVEALDYLNKIVADGIVDRSDDRAIEQVLKHSSNVRRTLAATEAALLALREAASE